MKGGVGKAVAAVAAPEAAVDVAHGERKRSRPGVNSWRQWRRMGLEGTQHRCHGRHGDVLTELPHRSGEQLAVKRQLVGAHAEGD